MPILGPTTDHQIIRGWAELNGRIPAELMPSHVNGVPAEVKLVKPSETVSGGPLKTMPWADFFSKFDQLGLEFVYDDDSSGYGEILQRDEYSPYRLPEHQGTRFFH